MAREGFTISTLAHPIEKKQAIVKVNGWKAKRKASGRGDQNVDCAMELTGWQIAVEETPEKKTKEPPA